MTMTMTSIRRFLGATTAGASVAAFVVSGICPADARQVWPEPGVEDVPPTFVEMIDVRIVNLEAVVVDREGQRVRGLGPGDFLLRVDGREVPIEYFTEIDDGRARAGGGPAEPSAGKPAGASPTPPPGIDPGRLVGTSYLVFIDDFLTFRPSDRDQVLESLADDLGGLGVEDRMAVVAFDGRKLEMLANWTGSRRELARTLRDARARRPGGLRTRSQVRDLENPGRIGAMEDQDGEIGGAGPAGLTDARGVPLDLCPRIQRFESQLHKAVLGATATLRGFAQPPGRKVMLLLSGGWPHSVRDYLAGDRLVGVAEDTPSSMAAAATCHQQGPALYRPIYETANLLGYTLYPIHLPGPAAAAVSADKADFAGGGEAADFGGENAGVSARHELHNTLFRLADETGGMALVDGARLEALERVVEDTRSYYWLGFTPGWKGNDRGHEVRLEVLRPGLKVRTRKGFQDLSRSTEVSFMVESALLFEVMPGAYPLELRLGPAGKGRRPRVPLEVVIPMDGVTMMPHRDRFVARLELRIAVLDARGDQNEIAVMPVVLEGPAPAPGARAIYETIIKLRREAHDVVVSLYDPLSDTLLMAKSRFEP